VTGAFTGSRERNLSQNGARKGFHQKAMAMTNDKHHCQQQWSFFALTVCTIAGKICCTLSKESTRIAKREEKELHTRFPPNAHSQHNTFPPARPTQNQSATVPHERCIIASRRLRAISAERILSPAAVCIRSLAIHLAAH